MTELQCAMTPEKVLDKAYEISSWLESAVSDMARSEANADFFCPGSKWEKKIKQAKKDGIGDISGAIADDYYNDKDTLSDLCGDRIYDESGGDIVAMILIAKAIKENAHDALSKAMDEFIAEQKQIIKEAAEETSKFITIGS